MIQNKPLTIQKHLVYSTAFLLDRLYLCISRFLLFRHYFSDRWRIGYNIIYNRNSVCAPKRFSLSVRSTLQICCSAALHFGFGFIFLIVTNILVSYYFIFK